MSELRIHKFGWSQWFLWSTHYISSLFMAFRLTCMNSHTNWDIFSANTNYFMSILSTKERTKNSSFRVCVWHTRIVHTPFRLYLSWGLVCSAGIRYIRCKWIVRHFNYTGMFSGVVRCCFAIDSVMWSNVIHFQSLFRLFFWLGRDYCYHWVCIAVLYFCNAWWWSLRTSSVFLHSQYIAWCNYFGCCIN